MTQRRTVRAGIAGVVLLCVALSSCTDPAAEPAPLPTAANSSETSAKQSDSDFPGGAPTLPQTARGSAGAAAFVRHWILILNYSAKSGTSDEIRQLSTQSCVDCDAIADFIDETARRGGEISGKGWKLLSSRLVRSGGPTVVRTRVEVKPQTVVRREGESPQRFAGGVRVKTFWLKRVGGAWRVIQLEQVGN